MTVRQLLDRIDSKELAEWIAYNNIEPFGPERADLRAAMVCTTAANCARTSKKQKAFKISDFMPKFGSPEPRPQSMVQLKAILKGLCK